jgi:hypothetical protein
MNLIDFVIALDKEGIISKENNDKDVQEKIDKIFNSELILLLDKADSKAGVNIVKIKTSEITTKRIVVVTLFQLKEENDESAAIMIPYDNQNADEIFLILNNNILTADTFDIVLPKGKPFQKTTIVFNADFRLINWFVQENEVINSLPPSLGATGSVYTLICVPVDNILTWFTL